MGEIVISNSPEETDREGRRFAARLGSHDIVWLQGPLAAGKTAWARGVVVGLGGDGSQVSSPTYGLIHEYGTAAGRLFHLDLYRLEKPTEVFQLALDDLYGRGPILIEWPERAAGYLGDPTYRIAIEPLGETSRKLTIAPR